MIDFLGIGAQKAGTTWIYQHLSRHPQICFPAGKEIHFWDHYRNNGVDWWTSLFADDHPGRKQGEITPAYATLDEVTGDAFAALAWLRGRSDIDPERIGRASCRERVLLGV